ncbi:MAG: 1-acyl-sn-glycerol-3-phosphate acyltransferase [Deltaproteobacteria bacterium]|nr:1-acyl-sn-glycerol-3-phosphate acyltransferase [Deltaproteobacteria bacterium]
MPIYLLLKFFAHYEVEGQENLKGLEDKAVIFASNHASYIDGPVSAVSMPRNGFVPQKFFPIRFLVAKEFFGLKGQFPFPLSVFAAIFVRLNGSIPIKRKMEGLHRRLDDAVNALEMGNKIWIYPEGRITTDGRFIRPGKKGIIYLHKETNSPIVPVGLIGTYNLSFFKTILRRSRVKVKIGKPIYNLESSDLQEGTESVLDEIEKLIKER